MSRDDIEASNKDGFVSFSLFLISYLSVYFPPEFRFSQPIVGLHFVSIHFVNLSFNLLLNLSLAFFETPCPSAPRVVVEECVEQLSSEIDQHFSVYVVLYVFCVQVAFYRRFVAIQRHIESLVRHP